MSTNYYLPQQDGEHLHIGKRSAGWMFFFRAQPRARSRREWEALVAKAGTVTDEYEQKHTPDEFWAAVDATREPFAGLRAKRRHERALNDPGDYVDADGWDFTTAEFS